MGQFYNGHQMTFGKNRVQYNDFYWYSQRYEKFDTYFNEYGRNLAEHVADYAKKEIPRIENSFDYSLDGRILFVVYNKLTDFRQSNIGLVTGNTENNIGGVVTISKNKVFLYFEGDYEDFERQVTAAITDVVVNQMLYGTNFRNNVTSSTLINLPEWFLSGLIAYMSEEWQIETENLVRDNVVSGKYKKFNRLTGNDAKVAGQAFWRYIGNTYGKAVIPNIIYLTKINKNVNTAFYYVLGASLKELSADWYATYKERYNGFEELASLPEQAPLEKRPSKKRVYTQINISPTGNYTAYITNEKGQYKIWLYNSSNGKRKRILKRDNKLEQITDYSYPVLAWHPSGRILTFITEEKGGLVMYYYTFGERKLQKRNILYFDKVLDYSFSKDGTHLVISAVKNGQTDIFVHNIAAASNYQITNDKADDFSPRFINNMHQIIFSSNRISDTISSTTANSKRAPSKDLFIYDYQRKSDVLMRLSDEKYNNKSQPMQVGSNTFISLNNQNGIINRNFSEFDSTISYIDTAIHYRYYANTRPYTNYKRNIIEQDYQPSKNLIGEIIYHDGRYYMYTSQFDPKNIILDPIPKTEYRDDLTRILAERDSLNNLDILTLPIDSIISFTLIARGDTFHFPQEPIDINNYIFEVERLGLYNEQLQNEGADIHIVEKVDEKKPRPRIYQKTFYQNYIVSQVDFSFLSESYQAFTGGAVYYNPGINLAFKIGTNDLFEDYKITAGARLPLDFNSSEYLVSFENLKNRFDWQVVYHRQTFLNSLSSDLLLLTRTITNEGYGIARYPFSQILAWSNTLGLREDQTFRVLDEANPQLTLNQEALRRQWFTFKTEFILDNTHSLGINLYDGTRAKIFGETYMQINSPHSTLYVVGADFRNYFPIHRNFIFASRFAYSSSMGNSKLIYYLGGVDNWTNLTPAKNPTFIPFSEIRIADDQNYAFQTTATNMRGFSQNIRNGNSFALINTELRFPVFSYFISHPLSNAFLENFQAVGFFDIGTAWTGLHPWSGENAYDIDIIRNGPIEIEIDANREPIVAGYGFGVRSQLFGYFVRLDWAWGIENQQVLPRIFYFSLSLDF